MARSTMSFSTWHMGWISLSTHAKHVVRIDGRASPCKILRPSAVPRLRQLRSAQLRPAVMGPSAHVVAMARISDSGQRLARRKVISRGLEALTTYLHPCKLVTCERAPLLTASYLCLVIHTRHSREHGRICQPTPRVWRHLRCCCCCCCCWLQFRPPRWALPELREDRVLA
jgi:hypothetical protein